MHILFVNEILGWFGGVEQYVVDTAVGLRARGHHCTLAYARPQGRDPKGYARAFDRVLPTTDLGSADRLSEKCFVGLAGDLKPDVIFIHRVDNVGFGLACVGEGRVGETRVVRMVHDHDLCCPRRHKYFAHNHRICRYPAGWRCWLDGAFIARGPEGQLRLVSIPARIREMRRNRELDGLLVGSEAMRRELEINGFPASRVHVVPPVIPLPRVEAAPPPTGRRVLYVGQLIRGKGVDLLLRALKDVGGEWRADIVGTGNAADELKEMARGLGLAGRVNFTGWVDHDRLAEFYTESRVVVVPSRWPEPFGLIGLEAANFARPVAAFAVGGIPDWLDDGRTGLLAPEQDTAALGRAIGRLLDEPGLAGEMGRRARQETLARFSLEAALDRLELHLTGVDS